MALYNWLVQSCCNPSITKVVKYTRILYAGIIFQDSLSNCYQVIAPTNATPNIFLTDLVPLYKTCDDCLIDLPPCDPKEPTTVWLVESCCDKAITQIVVNNNVVPGDIFQDSLGDCYTVLTVTKGNPTIVIIDETVYKTCEDCGKCIPPSPSVTPTVTQTPFPTQTVTPTITVTPSSTTYPLISKTPSTTPTATISVTPSPTASPGSPVCKCITYINTSVSSSYYSFYTTCDGFVGAHFLIAPQQTIQVCGSNPSAGNPAVTFYTGSACIGEECVTPDISPTPTPTPSATSVSGSLPEPDDLCMDIVFGPAPTPSTTPTATVSKTPSVTVSTSTFPIFPSISPSATPSVTPSITPTKTPTISVSTTPSITPSVTPTRTVTPTISVTKTPTASVTPTKTPTPTPSVSSGALVVPECSVIYLNNGNGNKVYSYNSTTNISTLLNLGTSPTIGRADDIAHTTNKLWLYDNTGIFEYNITLTPFTSAYNRKILLPVGISLGAGLCAVNDTTLISSVFSPLFSVTQIVQIALNPDNTTTISNLFSLPSERIVSGDIVYTTDGKIIVTTQTTTSPFYFWISQYIPNATGGWDLEFEKDITVAAPFPWGLAIINNIIYIFSAFYSLIQINNVFPYNTTQGNITNPGAAGSSQIPSCCNVSFQPNIIGASPSLTPTPTKTVTPTKTPTPSTTPFPTRTPTPTPSPTSNTTPCQGTLPMPSGSTTINGVTITASGTGDISLWPTAYASCNITTPANTIYLGQTAPFTYTLTFSQPVNNIRIPITALDNDINTNLPETFIFNTSGGTPTITSPNNCFSTITGNQISSNSTSATNSGGGGLFTISAPSSFNTLTITGQGGNAGAIFGIDCTSLLPAPPANCVSCNNVTLPQNGNGSITNGNLTINTTYSGPSLITNPQITSGTFLCAGKTQYFPTILLGFNQGPFIYTLNFNQPVNNIKFYFTGVGVYQYQNLYETFTFNTNGGVPNLSFCGGHCNSTINGNTVTGGWESSFGGASDFLVQVNATNPYNQVIITGPGGLNGSSLNICLDTATPLPSPSPSVTPTVTKSPSKTPSVTATPSISVSKTPSVTPSITATPSITISPSRTPSVTPSPSAPSAVCPLIYTVNRPQTQIGNNPPAFKTKNYTWNPNTNVQQEIVLSNDVIGNDIASTGTKLWKSFSVFLPNANPQFANYINEWDLSGNPPYTATFNRTLLYPSGYTASPGLTAKDNNTLVDVTSTIVNGQTIYKVYELNIPTSPATQLTTTFKFNLNNNFQGQGDIMLTSDANGNPDKLLLACNVSNPTPGITNNIIALQQYDYNTGAFEYETTLISPTAPPAALTAGIGQFNNTIYVFFASNPNYPSSGGWVYSINPNPPYNWTLVNNVIDAGGANSILACSKGKLVGPNTDGCNNILYKTQTSQYYSYNFSTNVSTLLNVPAPPYVGGGRAENNLANTSNKLWSYTYYPNGGNLSSYSIIEYNITNTPFSATINRYIALPKILNNDILSGNGLFALNNTKLVGTINEISYANLAGTVTEQDIINNPLNQYANGVMVVEYDITSNVATWTLKAKLLPNEITYSGLLVTTNNKLLVVTQQLTFNGNGTHSQFINQFNYNTGVLEFRKEITPIITTQCGLSEVNGNVYLMGYDVYKIDTIAPYNLTLVQTTGNQLVASSQLASCIDTNFPTSSCPECLALPLKLVTPMTYNGITIIPSYTGPTASDNTNSGPWSSCSGSLVSTQPPFSAFLGNVAGDYTYNLTFSQPVNNIKIQYNGTNSNPNPYELFTWNTSGGTPILNLCKDCYQTINNNTISASWSGAPDYIGGGGIITITAPSSYTTLTLTSPGGNQGTVFSICSSSIVPAPAVSPSPSPTPSPSPPCTPCALPNVIIGTQTWTTCNLDVTTYRNGDVIPQVTDPTAWNNLTTGAWCYYDNNPTNGCTYNKLYNWYAVNDPRGLAPVGYHVPTEAEIETLRQYLGGTNVAGGKLKRTGTTLWNSPNTGATNETGWTGLPGGGRENAQFGGIKSFGPFWTSTAISTPGYTNLAIYADLYYNNSLLDLKGFSKTSGYSVRLIKDISSLGCVYYSTLNSSNQPITYNYNPTTNVSTQVTLPTDTFSSFAETHTLTKYFKGNQTSTIKEWIPTNNPTILALNRTITVSGITSMFGNYFTFLQAINDTTLLTTIANLQVTPAGQYRNSLVRLDITNNTITAAQITTMFDIYAPAGLDSILLTSTNKLITIGRRNTPSAQDVAYLSQYSYPDGILEADIDISSTVLATNAQRYLFESNGTLFVSIQYPFPTSSTIYSININSPYTLTPVYTNMNLFGATFNSSINCNTVNLNVSPQPSPTPSPSPSAPSSAFRTIYKYLDIQLT
jgi:uncharacterized protein (TIGR02145 family)